MTLSPSLPVDCARSVQRRSVRKIDALLWKWLLLLLALSLPACSAGPTPAPALTPITVQLNWLHDAQFGGFYAADQNGDYAAEGLAVTFVEGGPGVDAESPLLEGQAQFGVAVADRLILARADGKPLRAIATIYRRSPIVIFSLAERGLTRPRDLVGKTINTSPDTAPTLHLIMARSGVDRDEYTEVNVGPDFALLFAGQVDAFVGFLTAGAVQVQQAGYDVNFIFPDDYGVHFYANSLITTDEFIATNPDLVLRFLRATLRGWTHAIENPAEIGRLVARYKSPVNADLEAAKMTASLPLINTGEDHPGWMKPEVWAGMADTLRAQELLAKPLDVEEIYTTQFLQEIYGP